MEAPAVPASERLRFRVRLRTRWSDEDNQGLLNNAVYLTLMEEGRLAYFTQLQLMEDWNRFQFVLLQCNARFLAPGYGGREVELELGTTHLGSSSFRQAYRVREAASGTVWCEAEAVMVAWDNHRQGKKTMEQGFRAAIARWEGLEG